ncbi:MAG: response regulator transcription factor [Bacteroidales bacterium]
MKKTKGRILLVEDDRNLGYIVKDFLEMSGYEVVHIEDGDSGLETFKSDNFDLCLLDIMLPNRDGFKLSEDIRKLDSLVPVIFLTSKTMTEDKLKGFKHGADDYITKPFSTEELVLRIEAILKRINISGLDSSHNVFSIGRYVFSYSEKKLILGENEIPLTNKQAELLRLLYLNRNKLLKRETALRTIWGEDDYFMGRSMDVHIAKLRKLLREDPNIAIINIHGAGFKLELKHD